MHAILIVYVLYVHYIKCPYGGHVRLKLIENKHISICMLNRKGYIQNYNTGAHTNFCSSLKEFLSTLPYIVVVDSSRIYKSTHVYMI